jgi:protein-S-isoprenylcysteine O-methyltransferase Ste14
LAPLHDIPHVIAPPPLLFAAFFAAGWILDFFADDVLDFPWKGAAAAGCVLVVAGAALGLAAAYQFLKAGTNILPEWPTLAVVRAGPYRLTRNPMYVGLCLAYAGLAIAVERPLTLLLLVPLMVLMHYGVVLREERYLEHKFGEAYLAYKRSARRWL